MDDQPQELVTSEQLSSLGIAHPLPAELQALLEHHVETKLRERVRSILLASPGGGVLLTAESLEFRK